MDFAICLGFTRNRSDAEDLVQEAYLRAHARRTDLENAASARAWLCRIARNACRDHLRRGRVRRLWLELWHGGGEEATAETPETQLQRHEREVLVKTAIAALPEPLRDVLVLREYGDLAYEEIAAALSVPVGTVMSRLHRARDARRAARGNQAMKEKQIDDVGRPAGYERVKKTIEAEKERELGAFRRSSFEGRVLARAAEQRRRRVGASLQPAFAGALLLLLILALVSRNGARLKRPGLNAAVVEKALRNAVASAEVPGHGSSAEDPRSSDLAWSIERIVAGIRRARLSEADLERLVARAVSVTRGEAAVVSTFEDPWQGRQVASLADRLERLRREDSVRRALAAHRRVVG